MKVEEREQKYPCSIDLMEAVRALDYQGRYRVCEAFYKMIFVGFPGDNLPFCRMFNNLFERIDSNNLEGYVRVIRQCVNEKVGMCLPAGPYVKDEDVRDFVKTIKSTIL